MRTEVFSACQAAPHTTPHKPRTPTRNNTRRQRQTDRDRQRQRKKTGTEREEKTEEDRQDKRREDKKKTRQDKRREKIHFQCGGARPFFVDVVLCLVHPVNARFLSLVNSVKYDSSLISFQCPLAGQQFLIICELIFLCGRVWAPAPEVPRMRSSMPFLRNLYLSKH